MAEASSVSVAFVGTGGAGALTSGRLLLEAACAAGWHGLLTRSVGPQIRGGEAAALLRIAVDAVECHGDRFDLLVGVDWLNASRFETEIALGPDSIVVSDPQGQLSRPRDSASETLAMPAPLRCRLLHLPRTATLDASVARRLMLIL